MHQTGLQMHSLTKCYVIRDNGKPAPILNRFIDKLLLIKILAVMMHSCNYIEIRAFPVMEKHGKMWGNPGDL